MIKERPLFGRGTGNFLITDVHGDLRSHVQFLEVLGENGAVGGLFYGAFLVAVGVAVARARPPLRLGLAAVCTAWLLTHFDNHNMVEYRFMVLPLALACGAAPVGEAAPAAA
jgi:O-antigen ligase